jgi:glycosyltransferase involved in cell wall biosynthesis
MRIAQIAPLFESVPPRLYGGTERVVSYLTEELVSLGHDVTLFASGDSETRARLVSASPLALWHDPHVHDTLPHHVRLLDLVFREAETQRFDVLHFHTDYVHLPLLRHYRVPAVTTLHGELQAYDVAPLLHAYPDASLVSISDDQRRPVPDVNWRATVHHGLPRTLFSLHEQPGDYLAFLGRMSPQKRVDRAIDIACRLAMPLKIAAKIYPEEHEYFETTIKPLLQRTAPLVEFVGEIGGHDKEEFIGNAAALLFPIEWAEPFGLVMIEALACGTPVVAWRRGSVPEVLTDGVTGYIVEDLDDAVRAIARIDDIDRRRCRQEFECRFDAGRMARDYVQVYQDLQER